MKKLWLLVWLALAATNANAQTPTSYTLSNGLGQNYQFRAFQCTSILCTASIPIDFNGNPMVGTAGSPTTYGLTVQGMPSGQPLPVTQTGVATSANQATNGATTSHTCSTGGFSELGCLGQIDDDIKGPIGAGTATIGNVVPAAGTAVGATPYHLLSVASNNATNVKAGAGTVYSLTITQTTTTLGDFRFYDSASSPTCSSATGVVDNYAVQSNAVSPGMHLTFPVGKQFANGISFCLTGAVADNDNTNFTTGVQINLEYK